MYKLISFSVPSKLEAKEEQVMRSFIPVSILVGIVAILVSTPADALCNQKNAGVCVTANAAKGWSEDCTKKCVVGGPAKKKRTNQQTKKPVPDERKSTMYAFPSQYGYPDFARENLNRPIDRQPLNPPSDLGSVPRKLPLH
jgi:hypothetical protein